jgi:hypothetical protein
MAKNGQDRVSDEVKKYKSLISRLGSVADKMERQIKGLVELDKKVKNRKRRKDD